MQSESAHFPATPIALKMAVATGIAAVTVDRIFQFSELLVRK